MGLVSEIPLTNTLGRLLEDVAPSMDNMNQVIRWSLPATFCFIQTKIRNGVNMRDAYRVG